VPSGLAPDACAMIVVAFSDMNHRPGHIPVYETLLGAISDRRPDVAINISNIKGGGLVLITY
tara:strand:- start:1768 stop:1953 length:186 start_codon:yes stop_codon:yes gene_type:complete